MKRLLHHKVTRVTGRGLLHSLYMQKQPVCLADARQQLLSALPKPHPFKVSNHDGRRPCCCVMGVNTALLTMVAAIFAVHKAVIIIDMSLIEIILPHTG